MTTLSQHIENPAIPSLGNINLTPGSVTAGGPITLLLGTLIRLMIIVGALIMIIFLVVGAFNWITSEGKPDKLEHARNNVIHAVVGMIILAATVAITSFIGAAFNIPFLQTLNINIPTL